MITFACIAPHPPLLLPDIGSKSDKLEVAKTIESLNKLGKKLTGIQPQTIVISSPHPDWGFNVPLHFLASDILCNIDTVFCGQESPEIYLKKGAEFYSKHLASFEGKTALIASGDLSHRLKADGPYGFHEQGPRFDQKLIKCLENNDIKTILGLENEFPEAGECGLGSFCFLLGILESAKTAWRADILSYEGPFGVGYLVADLNLQHNK